MAKWISRETECIGRVKGRFGNSKAKELARTIGENSKWAVLSFQTQREL